MGSLELITESDWEILDAVTKAQEAEDLAKGAVQTLIVAIVIAGRKLAAKKESLGHGAWLPWIETNLKIHERTVSRWMKLAKFVETKGEDIEDAKSVTEAYRLAGILPEPEASPNKATTKAGCFEFLQKIELRIEEQLGQIQPQEREAICDRLRRLINRLEATASQA